MSVLNKLNVLWQAVCGYVYKWLIDLDLIDIPSLNRRQCDVVVSLTSYGRRVSKEVVYYTLVSLLRQNLQPSRIILWLSSAEWQDDKLPSRILKLKEKGVEIRYCNEIRSYKKLIPCLLLCPNYNILTVDDDIIYTKDTIEILWQGHKQNKDAIICLNASVPLIENGVPSHYKTWQVLRESADGLLIFPVGCGGIFYPSGSLHKDVVCEDLFMKLCPLADDIWFWFCGLLNKTNKIYINKPQMDKSFDALYQYFHKGSALTHTNRFKHANDKQFMDLFMYYNVCINSMGNINSIEK